MRLVLKKEHTAEGARLLLACTKCDFTKPSPEKIILLKAAERTQQRHVAIIGEEEAKLRTMPTVKVACPKCDNPEAEWWMVQTRGSDESPTQFFKCTRCGYTWREMT